MNNILTLSPNVRQAHQEQAGSSNNQSNNAELMEMLRAMRQGMQERDSQLKVQLQLIDEYMDVELKRRDQNLEESLRLRDEEWKSKWEITEQELSEELKAREDAFILDRLKRDSELIKIMKEKEDAMEKNLLQKADAFGYLFMEHQKKIRLLIEKRDKELEGTLNYREKCWNESLDMINNNPLKMYSAQGEFEGTLNSIGQRQNDLIKKMALSMEWSALNRSEEGSRSKQP